MAVISDIIEGNSGELSQNGWELSRTFIVSELTALGFAMTLEAYAAVAAAGADIGDEHPEVSAANGYVPAYVFNLNSEPIPKSPNALKVTAIYRQFDSNYRYHISGNLQNKEVSNYFTDPTDFGSLEQMSLEYTFPADYEWDTRFAGKTFKKGVVAQIRHPSPIIKITRTERVSTAADLNYGALVPVGTKLTGAILTARNLAYAGTTNILGWNLHPTDPAGYWLCHSIEADSIDNGLSWQVGYTFEYNPSGWRHLERFKDPVSRKPVTENISEGNGYQYFDVMLQRNFTYLELS